MPEEKTETAEGLSAETLAWLDEEDKKTEETAKKIVSGEIPASALEGWNSENWQLKASGGAAPDIDVEGDV